MNRAETQVELTFDAGHSPSLSEVQRRRILTKLPDRCRGVLHLTARSQRRQLRNREAVTGRFRALLAAALHEPEKRRATHRQQEMARTDKANPANST